MVLFQKVILAQIQMKILQGVDDQIDIKFMTIYLYAIDLSNQYNNIYQKDIDELGLVFLNLITMVIYNLTTKHLLIETIKIPFRFIIKFNIFNQFSFLKKCAFVIKKLISNFYKTYKDISRLIINFMIPEMQKSYQFKILYLKKYIPRENEEDNELLIMLN